MTLTREANVIETSTVELLYCIDCERVVENVNGEHVYQWGTDHRDVSICTFPLGYAFCAPPAEPVELTPFDGDWAAQDDEPNEMGYWLEGVE